MNSVIATKLKAWGLNGFRKILLLLQLLVGRTEERQEPHEEDIAAELYEQQMPPYVTSCSRVTFTTAIPLINW